MEDHLDDHLDIHLVPKIGSPKGNPPEGTPFNPHVESFGWLVFNPHNVYATMVSTNCCTIYTKVNEQVVLQKVAIPNLY